MERQLWKRPTEAIKKRHPEVKGDNKINNVNTILSKEKLTCVTKKILKEEFAKQEDIITKLINENFQITIKEIKKLVYQDTWSPSSLAPKGNSKSETLIVKIFSLKQKKQIKYFQPL